jgi:hypothetical protein
MVIEGILEGSRIRAVDSIIATLAKRGVLL